jgi:predicted ArsR family transcriptional regulator
MRPGWCRRVCTLLSAQMRVAGTLANRRRLDNYPKMTLDNIPDRGAAERLMRRLKQHGPMTTHELAANLAISHEAVRQQLDRLQRGEWIAAETRRGAVGRPNRRWSLLPKADGLFPDAHAEMTVRLIEAVRTELGEPALDRLVQAHEHQTKAAYAAELAGSIDLRERVARLAAIRSREGYMAEWKDEAGGFLIVENHCPICAAARACQGFCRAEQAVFAAVLGPDVAVERTDHILAGARRCAYRITAV